MNAPVDALTAMRNPETTTTNPCETAGIGHRPDLVSVIVPVYRVEAYLRHCVDSILNQTYSNIEVILVDDGSPDQCGSICDGYGELDRRVTVIHKANGGLSDARNAGLRAATGNLVSFLDSDDWVHPRFVETLLALMRAGGADVAVCQFVRATGEQATVETGGGEVHEFTNIEALENLYGRFYVPLIVSWGKIFERRLFDGITFPVGKIHEDEFTTHKVLFNSRKVVLTSEPLHFYRQRPDSIMGGGTSSENVLLHMEALRERIAFFDAKGLPRLSDRTYEVLFHCFRRMLNDPSSLALVSDRLGFLLEFQKLKTRLRSGQHGLLFSVESELYYRFPRLARIVFSLLRRLKKWWTKLPKER